MRQGKSYFIYSGCGRVAKGTGQKGKGLVLQFINGVSSNLVQEGHIASIVESKSRHKICVYAFVGGKYIFIISI
jgi:hypothetical protein